MRINQVYSAFGPLGIAFKQRLGIPVYHDRSEPVIFFGCYGDQVNKVLKNESFAVIIWAGTDVLIFMKDKEKVEAVKARDNIKHIAISSFISRDLTSIGIDHKCIPIAAHPNDDISPAPLGDCIYVYKPKLYGKGFVDYAMEKLPHIEFITAGLHDHDREGILNVYRKCFIGLRAIGHDGLSNTVVEMGLMGRKCIWNGGTPNALAYSSKQEVVELIQREYDMRHETDYLDISSRMKDYMNVEDYLDMDIWT